MKLKKKHEQIGTQKRAAQFNRQRVMQAVHNKIMIKVTKEQEDALSDDADEIPIVSVKKNWMPTPGLGRP